MDRVRRGTGIFHYRSLKRKIPTTEKFQHTLFYTSMTVVLFYLYSENILQQRVLYVLALFS